MELVKRGKTWVWIEDGQAISPTFRSKSKAQNWFWDTFVGI